MRVAMRLDSAERYSYSTMRLWTQSRESDDSSILSTRPRLMHRYPKAYSVLRTSLKPVDLPSLWRHIHSQQLKPYFLSATNHCADLPREPCELKEYKSILSPDFLSSSIHFIPLIVPEYLCSIQQSPSTKVSQLTIAHLFSTAYTQTATMASGNASKYDPNFTQNVIKAIGPKATPRTREIFTSLFKHVHDFARETDLTIDEWMMGVHFINSIGQISTPVRNEGQRISDVIGLES